MVPLKEFPEAFRVNTYRTARLLVITRHTPLPGEDGGGNYLFDILNFLSLNKVQTEVIWFDPHEHLLCKGWWLIPEIISRTFTLYMPGTIAFGRMRIAPRVILLPAMARTLHLLKIVLQRLGLFSLVDRIRKRAPRFCCDAVAKEQPVLSGWFACPRPLEVRLFLRRCEAFKPDVVLANMCWLNPAFEAMEADKRRALRITLTHDVWHQKAASVTRLCEHEVLKHFSRDLEIQLLKQADVIVGISEEDAEAFRQMVPDKTVVSVPMSIAMLASEAASCSDGEIQGRCLFVGSDNPPNIHGLRWFLTETWPQVLEEIPSASLVVCGNVDEAFRGMNYTNVSFVGRQPSLTGFYAQSQVVICPLLQGGGVKVKLIEALCHGRACVTTPIGLQGLQFAKDFVLCAQDPKDFARAISRLLCDGQLRRTLGSTAADAVRERLDRETCYTPLLRLIQEASAHHTFGHGRLSGKSPRAGIG